MDRRGDFQYIVMPKPVNQPMNNCRVMNHIFNGEKPFGIHELRVMRNKNVTIHIEVTQEGDSTRIPLLFDRWVMDAVYVLYNYGLDRFTPEMVIRMMSGNYKRSVSSQNIKMVEESIELLSHIWIDMDCTGEMRARKEISKEETYRKEGWLLPVEKENITFLPGNHKSYQKERSEYRIKSKPVAYEYAESIQQFISVPANFLDGIAENTSDTMDMIVIRRYLIKRIEEMKNKKNHITNRKISYDWFNPQTRKASGLLPMLGCTREKYGTMYRQKRNRIHTAVIKLADYFVSVGYINGYAIEKEGKQKIKGIKVVLEEDIQKKNDTL